MKILFLLSIGFDRPGPSVHLLTDIVEQCLLVGHNVRMIVNNTDGSDPDVPKRLEGYSNLEVVVHHSQYLERGALLRRLMRDMWFHVRCWWRYRKYKDIDVVFVQSSPIAFIPIMLAKKSLKKTLLYNSQNIFPIDALAIKKLSEHGLKGIVYKTFRKLQQMGYALADRVVTISEDMEYTLKNEKVPAERLRVVHNWSYSDNEVDIPDTENLFLKANGITEKKFRVVFAGNMGAQVNARMIAKVIESLKDETGIHFYIIGDGANMPLLKKLVLEKKLDNVSFYPFQPVEFAPHNYAMANVNINALPKGIVYTCLPSKTAISLSCARPMVMSMEKESWLGKTLAAVDKCTVVDIDDVKGFVEGILYYYQNNITENSTDSRQLFHKLCSVENAKEYVVNLQEVAHFKN